MSRLLISAPTQSASWMTNLYGQVATVFGGYGVLGLGISQAMAKHGCILLQPYRRSNTDHRQAQMTSLDPNNWHPLMTDFNKPAQIRQLVEPADHIVICLGSSVPANTPLRWRDLQWGTDAVNRQLPVDITRHAVETGKETLVYISRIGANVDSKSAVLRAHGRAEIEIRELMPSAIIIRPSDVFSLIGNFNFDIMKQAARRLRYKSVPVYPEMMHRRSQPVQNLDIGVACAMALRDPSCWGKTYELGGRQELSYDELLNFVCSVTNSPKETIMMPYPVQKLMGTLKSLISWEEAFNAEYFTRMQYNAVANEFSSPDIYGWADLGIDERQLILMEELAPDALFNFTNNLTGLKSTHTWGYNDARFMH